MAEIGKKSEGLSFYVTINIDTAIDELSDISGLIDETIERLKAIRKKYEGSEDGRPVKTVINAEEAEAYQIINQEENCRIVREFLYDIAEIKDLPVCQECRTCIHCMLGKKKLPKIVWMNGNPFIFCTRHHEHFTPNDTCEFWKKCQYETESEE